MAPPPRKPLSRLGFALLLGLVCGVLARAWLAAADAEAPPAPVGEEVR